MIEFTPETLAMLSQTEETTMTEQDKHLYQLAADVRMLTQQTIQNVLQIGQKLTEIKSIVGHGNFAAYIRDNCGYSETSARRFMRIAKEYSADTLPMGLSISKLDELLALPAGDREEYIQTHDVESQTVQQLRAEVAQIKREKEGVESQAKAQAENLARQLEQANKAADSWRGMLAQAQDAQLAAQQERDAAMDKLKTPNLSAIQESGMYQQEVKARRAAVARMDTMEQELQEARAAQDKSAAEAQQLRAENARLLAQMEQAQAVAELEESAPQAPTVGPADITKTVEAIQNTLVDIRDTCKVAAGETSPAWDAWWQSLQDQLLRALWNLSDVSSSSQTAMPFNA